MKKLNILDLFSGCGGLSDGFEQTGFFNLVACVEWEKTCCLTHANRLRKKWGYLDADERVLRFDLQRTEELLNGWSDDPNYKLQIGLTALVAKTGGVDIILGGPPCQAYSIAGRVRDANGMQFDYRNYLFESYVNVVKKFKPDIFIFENVPGILSAKPGGISILTRITEAFGDIGYEISSDLRNKGLVELSLYGIPQNRTRVIIVGINRKKYGLKSQQLIEYFYTILLPKYKTNKKATVRDAIGLLPKLYPAEKEYRLFGRNFSHEPPLTGFLNHSPRFHNKRDIKIFYDLAKDIETGKNIYTSIDSLHELYQKRTGKKSNVHKYYVLRWDEQSNTIPAHLYKDGLRHIHPDYLQSRSLTVREAARLQTFDDDYEFFGSLGDQYKMIGNAVPPLFAKVLAQAIHVFWQYINSMQ